MANDLLQSRGQKPRRGAVLKCEQCGTEFYTAPGQVARRKYCSRPCRNAAIARTQRKACVRCGREFSDAPSIGKKWCSWACYTADRKPRRTCKRCGAPLKRGARTWCSHECFTLGRVNRLEKPCEVCGVVMSFPPNEAAVKRFCSRACLNQSKRITGPGARMTRMNGYVYVYYPTHPDASGLGYILEHRMVLAEALGRRLLPTEHVHHKNGIRDDNRPDNLEIVAPGYHARITSRSTAAKRRNAMERLAEYERRFGPLE